MVGDDQWHFNTGHGYDRAHTGPDGTTNDLRTTNLKHPGVRAVGDQGRRLRCDGNRRQAHGPPGGPTITCLRRRLNAVGPTKGQGS
jgi:hypothetical protein